MDKIEPASLFYRHKEGRCTCTRGGRSRRSSPNRGCTVAEYCRKYTVPHWRVRRRACSHPGCCPWTCGDRTGVLAAPAGGMVVAVEGTVLCARRGSVSRVLQAGILIWSRSGPRPRVTPTPFEGSYRRKSTREVRGVGSTVVGAVPSTSRTTSQVTTVAPQRPEWRSSDRSWRTGLRSQPLW